MELGIKNLNSEDVVKSRKEVDRVYELHREGSLFTRKDVEEAQKKASQHIQKSKPSPKSS